MKKRIEIIVDEATFASAFDAYEIALKQEGTPHIILFYSANEVWRDDNEEK